MKFNNEIKTKIIFKIHTLNKFVNKYYNFSHYDYSTDKTSNYSLHLKAKLPLKFYKFIISSITPRGKNFAHKNKELNNICYSVNKITKYHGLKDEGLINNNDELGIKEPYFCLKYIFDYSNHLTKYDDDICNYYWHKTKIINKGTFSKAFLG